MFYLPLFFLFSLSFPLTVGALDNPPRPRLCLVFIIFLLHHFSCIDNVVLITCSFVHYFGLPQLVKVALLAVREGRQEPRRRARLTRYDIAPFLYYLDLPLVALANSLHNNLPY